MNDLKQLVLRCPGCVFVRVPGCTPATEDDPVLESEPLKPKRGFEQTLNNHRLNRAGRLVRPSEEQIARGVVEEGLGEAESCLVRASS